MIRTVTFAALATFISSIPALAGGEAVQNGRLLNGRSINAIAYNGVQINAMSLNGQQINAISYNGKMLNAIAYNGVQPDGHMVEVRPRVVAIALADGAVIDLR